MIKLRQIVNQNILDFSTEQKYHAIISDPPYGLAFMNKGWDSFKKPIDYQKWVTEWSSHLMQFLYPGAICMFFGGTRTYHRLASGLEDAGYEIFDSMIWCYGSGFPKSYNISKGIDKSLGLKSEVWPSENMITNTEIGTISKNKRCLVCGKPFMFADACKCDRSYQSNSDSSKLWNGYGTAIKPAYEPIVLCRKPLEKGGYINSVLKYGTSGLNIDGGRIETNDSYSFNATGLAENKFFTDGNTPEILKQSHDLGRFPANFGLICTCEKEPCECVVSELDNQSGLLKSGEIKKGARGGVNFQQSHSRIAQYDMKANQGGASRFFYTAKASSKERELGLEGLELKLSGGMSGTLDQTLLTGSGNVRNNMRYNNHPTVKPIKLIEYLATLLLPPIENSSILIPFSGVGSEMIGSHFAGWQNITGVEVDENYVNIANKRLDYWTQFEDYESAMKNKANPQISYEDTLVAK